MEAALAGIESAQCLAELFLFLRQYQPSHPWQIVVIYPNRNIEQETSLQFAELLAMNWVRRIYLDELGEVPETSLGVGVVKLIVESQERAGELARCLIEQAQQQLTDESVQRDLINLIETIIALRAYIRTIFKGSIHAFSDSLKFF